MKFHKYHSILQGFSFHKVTVSLAIYASYSSPIIILSCVCVCV